MKIHPSKTKELIVSRARSRTTQVPSHPCIHRRRGESNYAQGPGSITRLYYKLTMSDHVSQVLSAYASSTFALRLLLTHSLKQDELHLVARATTVASILYASPAWWGFAGEGDRQINAFGRLLSRMRRGGICLFFPIIEPLVDEADRKTVQVHFSKSYSCLATPLYC